MVYIQGSKVMMRFVTNNAPIQFYSDDGQGTTPNMTISATGDVGIGTTSIK
ncbi:MAG: hypothetical protein R2764_05665 [Bacteroidales bacterium]